MSAAQTQGWADAYCAAAPPGDIMATASPDMAERWRTLLDRLDALAKGNPGALAGHAARQAHDLGLAFRLTGDDQERAWPLSPVPLLIGAGEWRRIESGLIQRAELLERVISDVYSGQSLVRDGRLPAGVLTGSAHYWRIMTGVPPPRGRHLHLYAADLGRTPGGAWQVIADRVRTPAGVGYALENRLALSRATGDIIAGAHARRLAPFFTDLRRGLAADCQRSEPRIGLLTPGRFNQSYAEQAHLARYLGLMLVEGDDLIVSDKKLFVRTIEGLKRLDGLWRWMDSRFLDPLAFDAASRIGVPDLYGACASGSLMIGNWPGAGIVESRAMASFLPDLCRHVMDADLILPGRPSWWCGNAAGLSVVRDRLDRMMVAAAFDHQDPGLAPASLDGPGRAALLEAMTRRPMDYVGQEDMTLSTAPAIIDGRLTSLPFTLRAFVARDGAGQWRVMPGGFVRLVRQGAARAALMGHGDLSADLCIVDDQASHVETSPVMEAPAIRRVAGMLPAKAADNLFWLGRYLERADTTLRLIRATVGGSIELDLSASLAGPTNARLAGQLTAWGAAPSTRGGIGALCATALGDGGQPGSVRALLARAAAIGEGLRDRLAGDVWRLIRLPLPAYDPMIEETLIDAATRMIERMSALAGLAAENMGRGDGWRFHDMGRRIERAITGCHLIALFGNDQASEDDLTALLDLMDSQISYRMRYLAGPSHPPVRDLLMLEQHNPRSVAFQVTQIAQHCAMLPALRADGVPEQHRRLADGLAGLLSPLTGDSLTMADIGDAETRLLALSDAIGQRFFLQAHKTQDVDMLA